MIALELDAEGEPLRLALDWDRRSDEHVVGLGARHGTRFDQVGRTVQLGADRRYTGPDCPAEMLAEGGIPQGDCAPVPWLLSSRAAMAPGWRPDGQRHALRPRRRAARGVDAGSARARCGCFCSTRSTPAARLREFCRRTGFPALLPEWGYGFWKSRDVYEHQDDVLEDFEGYVEAPDPARRDRARLALGNAIQHLGVQPPPVPRRARDDRDDARRRRAHRGVGHAVGQPRLARRTASRPGRESERLHREPAPNYGEGAAAGHFVQDRRPPFVTQWWMGTGSPVDFTCTAAEEWWRAQAKEVLALGVEGIKADDGDGYYIPDRVRLADGRTGTSAGLGATAGFTASACSGRSTRSIPAAASCSGAAAGPGSRPPA